MPRIKSKIIKKSFASDWIRTYDLSKKNLNGRHTSTPNSLVNKTL